MLYSDEYQAEAAPVRTHRLKNGTWFGFAEVDIEIPEPLRPKFEEMCPFFYNKKVPVEAVPQQMLDYLKRTWRNRGDGKKLVGALSAEKLLVYTPLLRWYVEHGAVITAVYRTIDYNPGKVLRAADSENQAKLKNAGRRGSADLNHISVG